MVGSKSLTWNNSEKYYELYYEKSLLDEWEARGHIDITAVGKEKKIFKINNKKYIFQPSINIYEELIFYNDNTGTHTTFVYPNTVNEEITTTHFKYTEGKMCPCELMVKNVQAPQEVDYRDDFEAEQLTVEEINEKKIKELLGEVFDVETELNSMNAEEVEQTLVALIEQIPTKISDKTARNQIEIMFAEKKKVLDKKVLDINDEGKKNNAVKEAIKELLLELAENWEKFLIKWR